MLTVSLEIDEEIEWWRPLVQWALCLPHAAYNVALVVVSAAAWLVTVPVVLVTGRVPRVLAITQVVVVRERARCFAYLFVLRRTRPAYATAFTDDDPGDDASSRLSLDVVHRVPRTAPIMRLVVVMPHVLVLLPVGVCLDVLYPVWMAVVSLNRGWPSEMARTLVAVERSVVEILLYVTMASDHRPQLRLRPVPHTAGA